MYRFLCLWASLVSSALCCSFPLTWHWSSGGLVRPGSPGSPGSGYVLALIPQLRTVLPVSSSQISGEKDEYLRIALGSLFDGSPRNLLSCRGRWVTGYIVFLGHLKQSVILPASETINKKFQSWQESSPRAIPDSVPPSSESHTWEASIHRRVYFSS